MRGQQRPVRPMMARRPAPGAANRQRLTTADVKKYVNGEPWTYYDTIIFSAGAVPPNGAAFNFAQFVSPLTFFSPRTVGNTGGTYALTNATDTNKLEADFLCKKIAISVRCDGDTAAAAGISTAEAFVESLVDYGVVVIQFGTNTKYAAPVENHPSGGGTYVTSKVRTQAMAANSDSATALNGYPTNAALAPLEEPILFRRGTAFSAQIVVDTQPAANSTQARIVALQALAGTFKAMVRVKLIGVRGTPLLEGTPSNY